MNLFTRNQTRERMKNKKTGELDHDKSTPAIPLCAANHVSSKQPLLQRFLKELNQIHHRPIQPRITRNTRKEKPNSRSRI